MCASEQYYKTPAFIKGTCQHGNSIFEHRLYVRTYCILYMMDIMRERSRGDQHACSQRLEKRKVLLLCIVFSNFRDDVQSSCVRLTFHNSAHKILKRINIYNINNNGWHEIFTVQINIQLFYQLKQLYICSNIGMVCYFRGKFSLKFVVHSFVKNDSVSIVAFRFIQLNHVWLWPYVDVFVVAHNVSQSGLFDEFHWKVRTPVCKCQFQWASYNE